LDIPKRSDKPLTAAQKQTHAAFKNTLLIKPPSDSELAKNAFDGNRERLKALRIAHDATDKANRND